MFYGRRKKSRKRVLLEWEKDGKHRFLRVVDVSGKAVAVVELDRDTLTRLYRDYD